MKSSFKTLNEYEFTSDTCIGYTTKGEIFVVDLDKYDLIKDYTWYISKDGYVVSNSYGNKSIKLHRLVTDCPKGLMVDHVNGVKTRQDNRICNLRVCTNADNMKNRVASSTTGVKGVSYVKKSNKFQAQICINGRSKFLGMFNDIVAASNAYDSAAIEYFGEYALLNKVQGPILPKIEYKTKENLNTCSICGGTCSYGATKCVNCLYNERSSSVYKKINREELKSLIRIMPFVKIGKMYSVTDNTIRKWCKKYNLPMKSCEIKKYSEQEWELI